MYEPKVITASRAVTRSDAGTICLVNAAAGLTLTLPAATGKGDRYTFVIGTTVTSNDVIIQVTGDDIMTGLALSAADGGNTVNGWETAGTSDTITLDGSTTGGLKGDMIELIDCAADTWAVQVRSASTGTEATPFSAAVS
ncbi:MAG: hypothetical protein ACE37E_01195 [Hyphomicrobiales bacterium]